MKLFGIAEAKHYCSSFTPVAGDAERSLESFRGNYLPIPRLLKEGTAIFDQYRSCSLRDVERHLFLAVSNYRRCLDLMISSASPWAYVTIYYGSWFVSRALLGMFGCAIFKNCVIDVKRNAPGNQELSLRRIGNQSGQQPTTYNGGHQRYWDLFYRAVATLRPMVQPKFAAILTPVGGDPIWQIDRRNLINYDSWEGLSLSRNFQISFTQATFPGSLPGILGTQFGILEALLELTFSFAKQFGFQTDALNILGQTSSLTGSIRSLIYNDNPPDLVKKTIKSALV
jgi:hypothetical protein